MSESHGRLEILNPSRVTVIKRDGEEIESVEVGLDSHGALFNDVSLRIEPGDVLARALPNGIVEFFELSDVDYFTEAFAGIQPNIQAKVKRLYNSPMRGPDGKFVIHNASKVTVIKADGRGFENVDAGVGSNTAIFNDPTLPLEVGDIVERSLPNGITEQFEITDPRFRPERSNFMPPSLSSPG